MAATPIGEIIYGQVGAFPEVAIEEKVVAPLRIVNAVEILVLNVKSNFIYIFLVNGNALNIGCITDIGIVARI
jgi:hypothetical protein